MRKGKNSSVVLLNMLVVHSDVPLKEAANGFAFQILLGKRSLHIRRSENQSSSVVVLEVTARNMSRHVPCIIFVCVYTSKKRKAVVPTLKNQQRTDMANWQILIF